MHLQHAGVRNGAVLVRGVGERLAHPGEILGQGTQHLIGEEPVDVVVDDLLVLPHPQPTGGPGVVLGQLPDLRHARVRLVVVQAGHLEFLERGREPLLRLGEPFRQLRRQCPGTFD